MRMTIPDIGTKIKLTKPWHFNLYPEERNKSLGKKHGYEIGCFKDNYLTKYFIKTEDIKYINNRKHLSFDCLENVNKIIFCSLQIGTVLIVDRIYIRKGMDGFSSITFKIEGGPYDKCRFWVKLKYANQIEFELPKQNHRIKYDPHLKVKKDKVVSFSSLQKYISGDNKIAIFPIKIYLNGTSDKLSLKQQIKFRNLTNQEFKESKFPNNIFGKIVKIEKVNFIGYDNRENKVIFEAKTLATTKTKVKKFCNENY